MMSNGRSSSLRSDTEGRTITQNIRNRVKNFFKSTKWFKTQTLSNSNKIDVKEDDPGSPPYKKMKFNYPGTSPSTSSVDTRNVSTNTDSTEFLTPVQPGMVTTPTPSPYSAHKEDKSLQNSPCKQMSFNFPSGTSLSYTALGDLRNVSTNTDSPEFLNPVQLGMVRSPSPSTYSENKEEKANYNHRISLSNNYNSVSRKRKSLCDPHDDDRPAHGSIFYPGETVYGGASSFYINRPNIKIKKNIQLSDHKINQDISIGHVTKKIYDLLENISCPVLDAKRITQYTNNKNSTFNTSVNDTAKTQGLPSQSLANILEFKRKARLRNTTQFARQLIASQSSSAPYILPNYTSKNEDKKSKETFTAKIKTKLSKPERGISVKETLPPLELPSNMLEIDMNNLPNFSPISSKPSYEEKNSLQINTSDTTVETDSITKLVDLDEWRCPTYKIKDNNPIESCVCCKKKETKNKEPPNTAVLSGTITNPIDIDKWRCPTCMIKNDNSIESCVCCGEKKPKTLESLNMAVNTTGSVTKSNISFANENMSVGAPTLSKTLVDSQNNKWECPGCYVRNEKNVSKCVCCETNKPGLSGVTQNKGFNFNQTNKTVFKFGINPKDYTKPETANIEVAVCSQNNNLSKPSEVYTHIKFTAPTTAVAAAETAVVPTCIAPVTVVVTSASVTSEAPVVIAASETSLIHAAAEEPEVSAASVAAVAPIFAAAVPEVAAVPITAALTGVDNNGKLTPKLPEYFQKPDKSIATEPTNTLVSSAMNATTTINRDSSTNELQLDSASNQVQNKITFFTALPQASLSPPVINVITPSPISNSPFLNVPVSSSSIDTQASNPSKISYVPNPVTSQSFFQNTNVISNPAPSTSQIFKTSETTTIGASNPSIFSFGNNTQNSQPQSGSSKFNFTFTKKNPGTQSIFNAPPFGSQPSNNIAGNKSFNLAVPNESGSSSDTGMMNNIQPGNASSTGNSLEARIPSIFSAASFGSQPSNNIAGNRTFNLAVQNENGSSGDTGMMNNILPGNALSTGNSLESRTPSIFSAPPFGSQPSNNIAGNRTFNLAVQNKNGPSGDTGMMNNILPGNALSTGNSLESRTPSIFSSPPFGSLPSNNIAGNRTFNLAVQNDNSLSSDTGMMNNILPGNALSPGNTLESRTPSIFSAPLFGSLPTNNVLSADTGMMNNNQMISENNLLGGHSSHSSGFHTQMNRDVWHPSNSSVNSFSFTRNTSFNTLNSAPAQPRFTQPQNIFGSQTPANAGGIFGAPRMPSTVVPTVPTFDRNFANGTGNNINFGGVAQTINGPFGLTRPEQPTVYNFGRQSNSMVVPQVQFNMGTSPGTPTRRVRKAIRRTPQR